MNVSSALKSYLMSLIAVLLTGVAAAAMFYPGKDKIEEDKNRSDRIIYEMEIVLLQCRRAEKNFLLRHDRSSAINFDRKIITLRRLAANMKSSAGDVVISALLEDIDAEIKIYKNAFQDITGLYSSSSFGPVHDPAMSKITDMCTLMAEPVETPSRTDTTLSIIGAARDVEYYINLSPENSVPLISMLQARRWEKNLEARYDILTGAVESRSIFCIRKIQEEISKISNWMNSGNYKQGPGPLPRLLESALKRYEDNLQQLSRNLDALYIKKRAMLGSARNLGRAISLIKGKLGGTRSEAGIEGIYYLSPKSPVHGQPMGNYHDVGSLVACRPSSYGYRHCKNWMQFYFDEDGHYTKENIISSVYFHIWIRTVNDSIDFGCEGDGKYSGGRGAMDDFISVEYNGSKAYSVKNGCSLITGKIETDYDLRGKNIYNFTVKLSRHSAFPSVVMEPNQYSFIIINPPSDVILKSMDSDGDGLNDHEEMFVYYTNPDDFDTDGDGLCDRTEVNKGTSPNINDLYSGRVIAGINARPYIEKNEVIKGDWIVDKKEEHIKTSIVLDGNLFVRKGGCLSLDGCVLNMNGKSYDRRVCVEKGGILKINNTEVSFNEAGYWYKTVEGVSVKTDCNLEIYGSLTVDRSDLKNGLGIKIHEGSKTDIRNSRILNCYHLSYEGTSDSEVRGTCISTFIGIPLCCKSSSPFVRDSILCSEYAGVGVYCSGASPSIHNSEIHVCEDEDSDSLAIVLVAGSHPVFQNTHFNDNRIKQDGTSGIVIH